MQLGVGNLSHADAGRVGAEHGKYEVREGAGIPAARELHDMGGGAVLRLEPLGPDELRALAGWAMPRYTAVESDGLVRATGLPRERVTAALDDAEWQRWLAADGRGYAFLACIVRDIVERDALTPGQRRRMREATGLET